MSVSTHIPRLDGLRALAILGVLLSHLTPHRVITSLSLGGFGVHLFFVLSGFLITRILIGYTEENVPVRRAAAHFYWRRFLRLAPPMFIAIVITSYIGIKDVLEWWWVHALYLSNFQVAIAGSWNSASHFWSLSVEEQFYLFWFAIVMLTPKHRLLTAIIVTFAIGPLFRLCISLFDVNPYDPSLGVLLPGKIDPLAVGALLAHLSESQRFPAVYRALHNWTVITLAAVALLASSWHIEQRWAQQTWPLAADLCALCLLRHAIDGRRDVRMNWLAWPIMRHFGKISYGLYVYHYFVPQVTIDYLQHFQELYPMLGWRLLGVVNVVISVALAEVSWFAIERPILRLKDEYFPISASPSHRIVSGK